MKINLYMDVYRGAQPQYLMASASPPEKMAGAHRFKIAVDVPDWAFVGEKEDSVLPVEEFKEVR